MTFPREIVDLLVNELVATKSNLGPLLWVSPIFNASARHAIFRDVRLTFDVAYAQNRKVTLLGEVVRGDPSVLDSIRTLYIGPRGHTEIMLRASKSPAARSLLGLLRVLATASAIKVLTISGSWRSFDMALLPKEAITHLLSLRSTPSLRSLIFHGLSNLPPSFIAGVGPRAEDKVLSLIMTDSVRLAPIRQIRTPAESILNLGDLEIRSDEPCVGKTGDDDDRILPALTSLELGAINRFLRSLCCFPGASIPHIHFPLLNSFSIMTFNEWDSYEIAVVKKIMKEAPRLNELEFRYSFNETVNNSKLEPVYEAIREAPMLSFLNLVCTGNLDHPVHLEYMMIFLGTLGLLPSLSTLWLTVLFSYDTSTRLPEEVQASYKRFETGLQELRRICQGIDSLRLVKFTVESMLQSSRVSKQDIDRFKEIFGQYTISDKVRFTYQLVNM